MARGSTRHDARVKAEIPGLSGNAPAVGPPRADAPPVGPPAAGPPAAAGQSPAEQLAELELLRKVLALTPARILNYDRSGGIRYATAAAGRALGLPPDKARGRTLEDIGISYERRKPLDEIWARILETRQPVHDVVVVVNDGVPRDTELHVEPTFDAQGEIDGIVVTAWDVSGMRQAVRRIRQLDRVRAILSQTNKTIVRVRDAGSLLAETCRIAVELGGFELAWVGLVEPNGDVKVAARAGRDTAVLDDIVVTVRDEPSGRGVVGTAIRENRPAVVEDALSDERMAAWRPQLTGRGYRTAAAFPLSVRGRVIGAMALYSSLPGYFDAEETTLFGELGADISYALESIEAEEGKMRAEEALRDSEQRYRELFEKNPLPMWIYEVASLRFLAVNDAAIRGYGYSRDEFLAMTLRDIRPPEDIPAMLRSVQTPTQGYRPRQQWRHLRKDGTVMDVEITGHDVDFDGRTARLISATDVTETRRLEAQLAEATRMEAMGHLAGGIAHDFNNLLTAVNGYAELLVEELGDNPLAADAREIRRAGVRAAELTSQVLAFARRQVLEPHAVDVNTVVAGVSQMLGRLIGEHVRLVTIPSPQPAVVIADPGQLEQVLVNMAINARDAMPDGGTLEIRVERLQDAATLERAIEGPAVLLTVSDTGTGMDETTLAHAFEPFFTTKQPGSGTGLGLAMVYGTVHQSHGEVWVESSLGHGTTFSVLMAAVDASPDEMSDPVQAVSRATGRETVLVVEDEPAVRGFVVATLERAGYRVLVASSPAEAVSLTDDLAESIDVLLTDMIMPGRSGQALAEHLLACRPLLHVILMSGYDPTLAEIAPHGPFHFLAKPFVGEQLTAMISKALAE